jgi:hypothetical protein
VYGAGSTIELSSLGITLSTDDLYADAGLDVR